MKKGKKIRNSGICDEEWNKKNDNIANSSAIVATRLRPINSTILVNEIRHN